MDDEYVVSDDENFVLSEDSCEKENKSVDYPDEIVINLTDPDELLYNSGWQVEESFHINEQDLIDMITDEPDAEPKKLNFNDDDDDDDLQFNIPVKSLSAFKKKPSKNRFDDLTGKFKILEKVGEGTFGTVYKAQNLKGKHQIVALKRIYGMCTPERIYNEINYLKILGGKHCVSPLLGGFRTQDQITLILPFMKHDKFKDFMVSMNVSEIRSYMRGLLEALAHVHANKILHRDIKPGNFLADIKNKKFMLIDFGLAQSQSELVAAAPKKKMTRSTTTSEVTAPLKRKAEAPSLSENSDLFRELKKTKMAALEKKNKRVSSMFASPLKSSEIRASMENARKREEEERAAIPEEKKPHMQAPRAGTRGFRAPEVLLRYPHQTIAIDVWAAGIVFLSILSTRYPFFKNQDDDLAALAELVTIFGSSEMQKAASEIGRKFVSSIEYPKVSIKELCKKYGNNKDVFLIGRLSTAKRNVPDSAFSLLERLLDLNPYTRITAKDALSHEFFKEE